MKQEKDAKRNNYNETRDNIVVNGKIQFRNDSYKRNLHSEIRNDKTTLFTNENKIEKGYESLDIEELHENEDYERLCESIIDKYFLSEDNRNYVNEIIKFCFFIAKNNNESIDYVMTDKQLLDLIYKKPLHRGDFIDSLGRMCPVIREH
ncbi:hypothetical protein COBT_003639, partial [Conglomerata obtusa]